MAERDPGISRELQIVKQSSSEVADEEGVQNCVPVYGRHREPKEVL